MTEPPDYDSTASLTVGTMRDAVLARPAMYFGATPPAGWPLVMLAWAATDLLTLATASDRIVDVTVHRDGRFTARVRSAMFAWPSRAASAEEALRIRQWWNQLARSTAYTIDPAGHVREELPANGHGLRILSNVDATVQVECDPDLVGPDPQAWWSDWLDRLPAVLTVQRFEWGTDQMIVALDERSATRRTFRPSTSD